MIETKVFVRHTNDKHGDKPSGTTFVPIVLVVVVVHHDVANVMNSEIMDVTKRATKTAFFRRMKISSNSFSTVQLVLRFRALAKYNNQTIKHTNVWMVDATKKAKMVAVL